MNNLTEHNIKLASLRYLKEYYKFRPRASETKIHTDMRGEGNIIADGYLTFLKEDEKPFTATLEATSFSTKSEVRFKLKKEKLVWDCTAIALSLMAILMFVSHFFGFYALLKYGMFLSLVLFFIFVSGFFGAFWLLLSKLRRYRHIYAIEQFKAYDADEQWVAIGEDVFSSYTDRYFRELQRQCVHFGFGLLVVNEALKPRMLITPARQQIFVSRRRIINFITITELGKRLGENRYLSTLTRPLQSRRLTEAQRWLQPYRTQFSHHRRQYPHQMVIIATSSLFLIALFIGELNRRPYREIAQSTYTNEMEARAKTNKREVFGYDIDSAAVQPFNTNVQPYIVMNGNNTGGHDDIIISSFSENGLTYYDCSRFYFRSSKYLVQDTVMLTAAAAVKRIYDLNEMGIKANALWLGCFGTEDKYVIFLGLLHTNRLEADRSRETFLEALRKSGARNTNLLIRSIEPRLLD